MNRREMEQLLKESGFTPLRQVRHGMLWTDGNRHILQQRRPSSVNVRNFLADVKRAVAARPVAEESEPVRILIKPENRPPAEKPPAPMKAVEQAKPEIDKTVKFPAKVREEIRGHIVRMTNERKRAGEIAEWLRGSGYTTPTGGEITEKFVANQRTLLQMKGKLGLTRKRPKGTEAKEKESEHALDAAPYSSPVITLPAGFTVDSAKVGPTNCTQPPRKPRMPDTCIAILTDPDLSDGQKVRMLMAYLEA